MKEIHRVAAAVIVATALAACSADPIGPSGRPSLLMVGATEAPPVHATDAAASTCAPSTGSGEELVSENSTYTVAYGCSCTTAPEGGDGQVTGSSTYTVAYDGCAAPPTPSVPPPPADPVPPPPTDPVPPPPTDPVPPPPPPTDPVPPPPADPVPPPPLADPVRLALSFS